MSFLTTNCFFRFPKLHVPLAGRPSAGFGETTSSKKWDEDDELVVDKDGGRDRRQTQMLMEDMDAFDELEEILDDVSLDCNENYTRTIFVD